MLEGLLKSKGLFRTIGSTLAGIGTVLTQVDDPQLILIGALLLKVGGSIGGVGVIRAAAAAAIRKEVETAASKPDLRKAA
jgi:hypothetical protein